MLGKRENGNARSRKTGASKEEDPAHELGKGIVPVVEIKAL